MDQPRGTIGYNNQRSKIGDTMTSKMHTKLWEQAVSSATDWLRNGSATTTQQRDAFHSYIEQLAEIEKESTNSIKRLVLMDAVEIVAKEQQDD